MMQWLIMALPIAVVWVAVTGNFALDSLLLGYVIGIVILFLLYVMGVRYRHRFTLDQPVALLIYTGGILWSGLICSFQVARMILSPKIELKTGIVALGTGDLSQSQLLTALSAHGINATPGEVVVDIADGGMLYIHCLDLATSQPRLEEEQIQRLKLLKRILGEPANE